MGAKIKGCTELQVWLRKDKGCGGRPLSDLVIINNYIHSPTTCFGSLSFLANHVLVQPKFWSRPMQTVAILASDKLWDAAGETACLVMTSRYMGLFCGCRDNRSDLFCLPCFFVTRFFLFLSNQTLLFMAFDFLVFCPIS